MTINFKLFNRFFLLLIIVLLFGCKTNEWSRTMGKQKNVDISLVGIIEDELTMYFNMFPNFDEIRIIELNKSLIDSAIDLDYYSKQELLFSFRSTRLEKFIDSVELVYLNIDSVNLLEQLNDSTFQKKPKKKILAYIPYGSPLKYKDKIEVRKYIANFNPDSCGLNKLIFYPFVKDYNGLKVFTNLLQEQLKFQILDMFWFNELSEEHLAKVSNIEIVADRTGHKYESLNLDALEIIKGSEQFAYLVNHDRYTEVYDSLKTINRFDNRLFIGDQILWVKLYDDKIYISPFLIRAAYLKYLKSQGGNFDKLVLSQDVKFAYYGDFVVPELIKSSESEMMDIIYDISSFKSGFYSSFYFIVGHELAHQYLGNHSVAFQDELICDCYSATYLKNCQSDILLFNEEFEFNYPSDNLFDYDLGIYKTFILGSLENGIGRIWGLSDKKRKDIFLNRYSFITNLPTETKFKNCDNPK